MARVAAGGTARVSFGIRAERAAETGDVRVEAMGKRSADAVRRTLRVLPDVRSTACRVTVDGELLETQAAMVLIMNCGEIIPPIVRVRPDISPEDGLLDLLTIAVDSPWQGMRGLLRVLLNASGDIRHTPYLRYARGRRFTVETAEFLPVQFDGDPVGGTPFTVEVVPKALTVMTLP